jgi:transcriptional regulator with XRE-family HTH domain
MPTPKDLPRDIGEFIRDLRRNARISLRQLADQAGVSNPYLSQIERGLRRPSAEVLQQIAGALRVSTPLMYLRAGLLDGKEGHNVLEAIAADPDLTAAQKQSLIQIYETFRRENAREAEASAAQAPAGEGRTDAGTDSVVVEAAGGTPAGPSGAGATGPADQADGPAATVPEQQPKPATNAARKAATTKEI